MRIFTLFSLLFTVAICNSQALPINFETSVVTSNFINFDGGTVTVINNPQMNGINTSSKVAQMVRNGGQVYAGSKLVLSSNLDFTTLNTITMKFYTGAPIGTSILFKLEGNGSVEREVKTTVVNQWEVLKWDFTGSPKNFNTLVFIFDFGKVGNGSATSTFLFDDIQQVFGGKQIDLPVDFEGSTNNYTMTDFGGNASTLVTDPTNPNNKVMEVIKTAGAELWAGTTIGTGGGFASNIPLTLTKSKMTVKVWSPNAGTPIRLKVEDSKDPTRTCETQTNTTVAGAWEIMTFDFTKQVSGTATLSDGLSRGWTYNLASIFFNFGTTGAAAGAKKYYFDNVAFGDFVVGLTNLEIEGISAFPNPANNQWTISSQNSDIDKIEVFDLQGKLMLTLQPNSSTAKINASDFVKGVYISKISTGEGTKTIKLFKN
jgi:hypothetical protein